MAKYQKKRKEPNFIFKFEDGEPTKEECVADMAKVFFLLWEAQKRGLKNAQKKTLTAGSFKQANTFSKILAMA